MTSSPAAAESAIVEFFTDATPHIRLVIQNSSKWIAKDEAAAALMMQVDTVQSASLSVLLSMERLRKLSSFQRAEKAFQLDSTFSSAKGIVGQWGTFETLLQLLAGYVGIIENGFLRIEPSKVLEALEIFRATLSANELHFKATARLFGVRLEEPTLKLPACTIARRLTLDERNRKQPFVNEFAGSGNIDFSILSASTEVETSLCVAINRSDDGAVNAAKYKADQLAFDTFETIKNALLVATPGLLTIGHVEVRDRFLWTNSGRSFTSDFLPRDSITLTSGDAERIETAFKCISGRTNDKTLGRALHRFILGRQRSDLVDKLVDYVIAWEAVLLTNKGSPLSQELSYRFSINGATLINASDPENDRHVLFEKMKCAYSTRSAIVHGGDNKKRDAELGKGNFRSLQELCNFLESSFRNAFYWLNKLPTTSRPYAKSAGWEILLWKQN